MFLLETFLTNINKNLVIKDKNTKGLITFVSLISQSKKIIKIPTLSWERWAGNRFTFAKLAYYNSKRHFFLSFRRQTTIGTPEKSRTNEKKNTSFNYIAQPPLETDAADLLKTKPHQFWLIFSFIRKAPLFFPNHPTEHIEWQQDYLHCGEAGN